MNFTTSSYEAAGFQEASFVFRAATRMPERKIDSMAGDVL
jgi:hypothetical protein